MIAINNAGTNCVAALTNSETEALLNSDRCDKLNIHIYVVAGHAHLCAFGKGDNACNVSCSEIELRSVVVEERCMTAAPLPLSERKPGP